jgi:hypothetical protein
MPTITITIIVIVVAAVATFLLNLHRIDDFALSKPPVSKTSKSEFSFNSAQGWWQGTTSHTSMALSNSDETCYVAVEHESGTLNVANELLKEQTALRKDGYTVTPASTQIVTIQTKANQQPFDLQQYTVTSGGDISKKPYGGQEFGYLKLKDGYLSFMGYCSTVAELKTTIPALSAITYNN